MSGLSYLCGYGYGSNSDDSDCEYVRPDVKRSTKRSKLPTPDLSKVAVVPADDHVDDAELHGGRTRSFPHVRGDWATFVYVKYPAEEELLKLINSLKEVLLSIEDSCQICEDLHISLSKTVVLKYHFITPFTTSLQAAIDDVKSFDLGFDCVNVYCNEEKTRTFLALKVDYQSNKYLQDISKNIDDILVDFKLPTFYDDASFHMSILWINGNKKTELTNILQDLNDIVTKEVGKTLGASTISKVNCKIGNKQYQYFLK